MNKGKLKYKQMKNNAIYAKAQMGIHKPAAEVFEAFVDPAITRNFWFTGGTGRLKVNQPVEWEWEMYQLKVPAVAKIVEPPEKLVFEWGSPAKTVEILFHALEPAFTWVDITERGPVGEDGVPAAEAIIDSTGGFTTVLDGMKAYLEHGLHLNLIKDKYPKAAITHGKADQQVQRPSSAGT